MLLLDVQEKFSSVNKATREKFQRDKDDPNRGYYRLRDGNNWKYLFKGRNLFDADPEEYLNFEEVFELILNENNNVILEHLALLPSLTRLTVQYSKIVPSSNSKDFLDQKELLFPKLEYLDLSFNNLTNDILNLFNNNKTLKTLILMGNSFNADIPDLSGLVSLEDLNLSYNKIETLFLNDSSNSNKEKRKSIDKPFKENINSNNSNMNNFLKENISKANNISAANQSKDSKNKKDSKASKYKKESKDNLEQEDHSRKSLSKRYASKLVKL